MFPSPLRAIVQISRAQAVIDLPRRPSERANTKLDKRAQTSAMGAPVAGWTDEWPLQRTIRSTGARAPLKGRKGLGGGGQERVGEGARVRRPVLIYHFVVCPTRPALCHLIEIDY